MIDGSDPVPLPVTAASGTGYQRFNLNHQKEKPLGFADVLPGLYDPAERLRAQDADSVQAEVLYPSAGLWEAITALDDRDLKLACARAYNDWIAEFSAHSPDRLIGLAKIPSTTCEDAREELLRCVKELNLRGAILDAWPSGNAVAGNADDDPFWDAVNEARVPVSLHYAVGRGQGDPAAERHRSRPEAAHGRRRPAPRCGRRLRPLPEREAGVRPRQCRVGLPLARVHGHQLRPPPASR